MTVTTVIGEVSTSWSFVGAGLRVSAELLGPEYSMAWNTLDSGLKVFFSRAVRGKAGEDLLEKQNAEVGLMPVVANEAPLTATRMKIAISCACFSARKSRY